MAYLDSRQVNERVEKALHSHSVVELKKCIELCRARIRRGPGVLNSDRNHWRNQITKLEAALKAGAH